MDDLQFSKERLLSGISRVLDYVGLTTAARLFEGDNKGLVKIYIQSDREWLNIKEAAEYVDVSVRTINTWRESGLKSTKHGGIVRIKRGWIDNFLSIQGKNENRIDKIVNETLRKFS